MFRVRKLNRQGLVPDARAIEGRPRLQEFIFASKRQRRRQRTSSDAISYRSLAELQRREGAPEIPDTLLMRIIEGKTQAILVPLSHRGHTPSMAETMRFASALSLMRLLEQKGVGPLVIALWAGIPEELDSSDRLIVQRDGRLSDTSDLEPSFLHSELPQTEFTEGLDQHFQPSEAWQNKAHILRAFARSERVIVLPPSNDGVELKRSVAARSDYRVALARTLERFPVIGLIHPSSGETLSVDTGMKSAFEGEVIPFPTTMATIIEAKVERWLEKYDLAPEELMARNAKVASLVADRFPRDAVGIVSKTREAVLARIFQLEHQVADEGFPAEKVLDKLANQLDSLFDKTKHALTKREAEERKLGHSQLTKARTYLRPRGELQYEAMSLIHYLNFYGDEVLADIVEAIQVGDSRHHLLYASS